MGRDEYDFRVKTECHVPIIVLKGGRIVIANNVKFF